MTKDKLRQALNLLGAMAMPSVAVLAGLGVFGPGIGEVSNRYPTYVVPAGYAFMIWNLIYALTLSYGIWQALPGQRTNQLLRRIGWATASATFACAAWVPIFQRSLFELSVFVILWALASLIAVVALLYGYRATLSHTENWLVYVNFSVFLGWLTVATVANIGQTLTARGWSGWGLSGESWGLMALALAGLIAAAVVMVTRGNVPYALTIVWAFVAVAVNQLSGSVPTSSVFVGLAALAMSGLVLLSLWRSRQQRHVWFVRQMPRPAGT